MHRILIADDHIAIRQVLITILQDEFEHLHIGEAIDTPTLIEKAFSSHWDLIISDLAMPGGGGLYALKEIKQSKPEIPVLIVSTHPQEEYEKIVLAAGAEKYINKSNLAEQLISTIKKIVDIPSRS